MGNETDEDRISQVEGIVKAVGSGLEAANRRLRGVVEMIQAKKSGALAPPDSAVAARDPSVLPEPTPPSKPRGVTTGAKIETAEEMLKKFLIECQINARNWDQERFYIWWQHETSQTDTITPPRPSRNSIYQNLIGRKFIVIEGTTTTYQISEHTSSTDLFPLGNEIPQVRITPKDEKKDLWTVFRGLQF